MQRILREIYVATAIVIFIIYFIQPNIAQAQEESVKTIAVSSIYSLHHNISIFDTDDYAANRLKKLRYIAMLSGVSALTTPYTDPYYNSTGTWGQAYDDMWGLKRINIEDAWKLSTGKDVIVAVLDSGIDYNHIDINGNIWTNDIELNGIPGIDDDGNGYIDDIHGWDFHYRDNNPMDGHGHGTHVAGIIGAEGDNNEGIIGVSYEAKIMPVKIISDYDTGYYDRIAEGIRYAVDMGARVLNCSFGVPYNSTLVAAFQYAFDKGAIIIAAAGNDGGTIDEYPAYLNYTVAVGSIDEDNTRSYFSNYGTRLDVVAPGEDILSLRASGTDMYEGATGYSPGDYFVPLGDPNAQYYRSWGTSMAAPFVSGLAALLLAQDSTLTYEDFIRRLRFSSTDLGVSGRDNYYGYGRIDALAALSHDWYDSGAVKTWWLLDPDPNNVIRYDYYELGNVMSRWLNSPDLENVIRYDYFESGALQSKWLDTPDIFNVIRYSFFESGRLDSKWLHSPDVDGNVRYAYYNEDYENDIGRDHIVENSNGVSDYNYGFLYSTGTDLINYQSEIWSTFGSGIVYSYYDSSLSATNLGTLLSKRIEFDNGDVAEANVLSDTELQITKFYNSTTSNKTWFLWGEAVYGLHDNVVIEEGSDGIFVEEVINVGDYPSYIAITRDGNYAYVADSYSDTLSVISTSNNSIITTINVGDYPNYISIVPNGNYAYVTNYYSDSVSVINTLDNSVVTTINVGDYPSYISIAPNGNYAYVPNFISDTVSVINTSNNTVGATINVGDNPQYLAISPDGNYVYVANSYSDAVSVINTSNNLVIKTVSVGNYPYAIAITYDGNYAYVCNYWANTVSVIDTSDNSIETTITVGSHPYGIVFTPDGNHAYVTNELSDTVSVIDTSNNSIETTIAVGDAPRYIAITPDGNYVYVSNSSSGTVSVINTLNNAVEKTLIVGSNPGHIAINPIRNDVFVANRNSDSLTKISQGESWKAYTFIPDSVNPYNVLNKSNWTLIGTVSDPNGLNFPELGDWWDYVIEKEIIPEFPPLSSDYSYDGQSRVIEQVNHNTYLDTTYTYTWDYQQGGQVKMDMSYDHDEDGLTDIIYSRIYKNGTDYDIDNINTWQVLSEASEYYKSGILKKRKTALGTIFEYFESGNLKRLIYPDMGEQEFEDYDFYGGNRGRITREMAVDGFYFKYLEYYSGTDVPGRIEIYDKNDNWLETRWYYFDLALKKTETADGSIMEYDSGIGLTRKVTPDGYEYTYDATGRVTLEVYPDGSYFEDLLDRPTLGKIQRDYYSDNGVLLKSEIYSYIDPKDFSTWMLDETITPGGYTAAYDGSGRLMQESVPGSYTIDYLYYDLTPIVKRKTYTDLSTGETVIYEYDALSRVTREMLGNIEVTIRYYQWTKDIKTVTGVDTGVPDNELFRYEYRTDGTLKEKIEPGISSSYDVTGRIKFRAIEDVSETFVSYLEAIGNIFTKKIYTDLTTGNSVIYTYYTDGKNKETLDLSGWHAEYDSNGRIVKEYNSFLETITYTYHGNSFNIASKRRINTIDLFADLHTYDTDGSFIGQTVITNPIETRDVLDRLTKIEYYDTSMDEYTYYADTNNVMMHTYTDMDGKKTIKEYDINGDITKWANPDDTYTEYTYDGFNRLTRKDFQDGSYETITYYGTSSNIETITKVDVFSRTTIETYDAISGLITQAETWDGRVTTFQYDAFGRLTRQDNPDASYDTYTYYGDTSNINIHIHTKDVFWNGEEYREDGQIDREMTVYGNTADYSYDGLGRLIRIDYSHGSSTAYEYLNDTNKITRESYSYNGALKRWTDYSYYDDSNRIKSKTYNSISGSWDKHEYDIKNSQLIKKTNSNGYYSFYEYDGLGRLVKIDLSNGHATIYTYFGSSDMKKTVEYIDAEGRGYLYEYNDVGRIIRARNRDGSETAYTYDSFGRVERMDYSSGEYTEYAYTGNFDHIQWMKHFDIQNNLLWSDSYEYYGNWEVKKHISMKDGQTATYEYLSGNRLLRINDSNGITSYNYDLYDRLESILYPTGEHTDYEYYDTSDRRKKITKYNTSGEVVSYEEWTYHDSTQNHKTYKSVEIIDAVPKETLYEYNPSGRLYRMTDSDGIVAYYSYDGEGRKSRIDYSNGNYTTIAYVGTTEQIAALTRYYAEDGTAYNEYYTYYIDDDTIKDKTIVERNGDTAVYHYTEEGVLLIEELPDGRTAYYSEYDGHGWVTRKDFSDGSFATYEYDGDGNPIETYHPVTDSLIGDSDGLYQDDALTMDLEAQMEEERNTLKALGVQIVGNLGYQSNDKRNIINK